MFIPYVLILFSYICYREDQKSKFDTIESDLFQALHKSGVILEEHAEDQKTVSTIIHVIVQHVSLCGSKCTWSITFIYFFILAIIKEFPKFVMSGIERGLTCR